MGERFYDYCHKEYDPKNSPVGKLISEDILKSCPENKLLMELSPLLKRHLGKNSTIWGLKKKEDTYFWELYFYLHDITPKEVFNALSPMMNLPSLRKDLPYFMISIDLDDTEGYHMYFNGGASYFLGKDSIELENYYRFYRPKEDLKTMLNELGRSAHSQIKDKTRILRPELIRCHRSCLAYKRTCDGVYFSRIDIDQFMHFLDEFEYPEHLKRFIRLNRHLLDHQLFDVGFDYTAKKGEISIIKSGFYGTI